MFVFAGMTAQHKSMLCLYMPPGLQWPFAIVSGLYLFTFNVCKDGSRPGAAQNYEGTRYSAAQPDKHGQVLLYL